MADTRHVFTILEDNTSGAGVKLPARAESDTAGGNHVPSLIAKDSAGAYRLLNLRDEGNAVSGIDALPVLPVKDAAGNFQYINARDEGNAASGVDALPGLVAKDAAGNLVYLRLNADNELVVSNNSGSPLEEYAKATPAALNTLTTVVELALTPDEIYEEIALRSSSFHPVMWELVQVDDATVTVLDSFLSGPGQFTWSMAYKQLVVTAGSTGDQFIRLRGTQLTGAVSDMHGYVEASEKA